MHAAKFAEIATETASANFAETVTASVTASAKFAESVTGSANFVEAVTEAVTGSANFAEAVTEAVTISANFAEAVTEAVTISPKPWYEAEARGELGLKLQRRGGAKPTSMHHGALSQLLSQRHV